MARISLGACGTTTPSNCLGVLEWHLMRCARNLEGAFNVEVISSDGFELPAASKM